SSVMDCSSCHASESGRSAGGVGPSGTHGSSYAGLLSARYEVADNTSESASVYALCYKCHDRANILNDVSFKEHKKHIVDLRAPCAACHDAHGIGSAQGTATGNSNLINFATAIVTPSRRTGRLEYRDTGRYRGQCYLTCHGEDHGPLSYP
ncbi:MAG: cytochrome C, partial [Planctomycetota bacterium]|nr:cytochrome C [Planctomycetota bacterium]